MGWKVKYWLQYKNYVDNKAIELPCKLRWLSKNKKLEKDVSVS